MIYKNIFKNIYENWGFGSLESRSGPGSTLDETKLLREKIKSLVQELEIKSVVDIPCGDFNWMKEIVNIFQSYTGGDIVDEAINNNNTNYSNSKTKFVVFDLINDNIPDADLLIVRDVIGHLPLEDGKKIINNILKSNCRYFLSTTWAKKNDNGEWENCKSGQIDRENEGVEYGRFYPVNLMAYPFNFPKASMYLEEDVVVDGFENGNRKVLALWDLDEIRKNITITEVEKSNTEIVDQDLNINSSSYSDITLVTGLWDIGRGNLEEGWSRSYSHYIEKFKELLKVKENLIIFGDAELEKIVFSERNSSNTQFIFRDLEWFKNNNYYNAIQNIRTNPDWLNQTGWLIGSTQAKLDMYNPLVMSKVFLLNDATIMDRFNSKHMYWIDAGITNTVHPGYFTHDRVSEKIAKQNEKFTFICFPYETTSEIHGFNFTEICKEAGDIVNKVARGGFFGGPIETIKRANEIYYDLLMSTLNKGLMGTEESLFTIMLYKYSDLFKYAEITDNGLIGTYFENVKNNQVKIKSEKSKLSLNTKSFTDKSALYVITYNSPKQFKTLIESMLQYDRDFLDKTTKFLLDNSNDASTFEHYSAICKEYNFEHIKKDNLGICGGRQFIAEHFAKTDLQYMYFFEDDMFFYPKRGEVCKSGFNRFIDNLYVNTMQIIQNEDFDFLKLSFSEFFGNNSTQWAWYNVPQVKRQQFWPNYSKLPEFGIDENSPKTKFNEIKILNGLPYAAGEVYYCNWPQLVSKSGNKKMFLDTTWAHPYEQTWMSHIFQETVAGNIKPGLLLLSPTEHNRFDHYDKSLRKES